MVSEHVVYALSWASWGGIIAGVVAALAVSIVMTVFGVALGSSVVQPKDEDPASGLEAAFGIWSFLSVVVSMCVGGFVSGLFAGRQGAEHGFMVWAVVLIVATCGSRMALGAALKTVGAALRGLGSGAVDVASTVGKGAARAGSSLLSEVKESLLPKLDADRITEKLSYEITSTLRDTGIETLQADYLKQQVREAGADLRVALRKLALDPRNAEKILTGLLEREKSRLSALTEDVDRDAAVEALMKARGLSRQDAETITDNAVTAYREALDKARDSLSEAREQMEEVRAYVKDMTDQAREKADRASSSLAKAALAAGLALLVAAVVSMGAGCWGAKSSSAWYVATNARVVGR